MPLKDNILEFLIPTDSGVRYFTHRTYDLDVAQNIMDNGFAFVDTLYSTTDIIVADAIHLQYWHNLRKFYGDYIVVIGISDSVYRYYSEKVNNIESNHNQIVAEQIMTEALPFNDQNDNLVFTLPHFYIKGYCNSKTDKIIHNPSFTPDYNSDIFKTNLEKVKSN